MRIFLTASKDATLYQRYPTNNSGLDEILEVGKVAKPEDLSIAYSGSAARTVISFNLSNSASFSENAKYFLNLKIANATNLPYTQEILINKLSVNWTEGGGYFVQQTKNSNDGATWQQATKNVSWSYGGSYDNTPSQSIILDEYPLNDLRVDVTNIIQPIVQQSLSWNGFILAFPSASELDQENEGNIKFFSKQTHTVHQPTLEVAWDDSTFVTGSSLKLIPNTTDIHITPKNSKQFYVRGSKEKVRLVVRDKYPLKSFDATLRYKNKYYLPTSSYFSIVDMQAGTTIYPDDIYGKISCDPTSSFFVLDTAQLYKNRYYSVHLRVERGNFDVNILPDVFTFLVK